jgi:hypothetical protein
MSIKQIIEEKLGHEVNLHSNTPNVRPTRVFTVSYTTSKEIAVTHIRPCDTAIYFEGLQCPFDGVTLLIARAVAVDWGLTPASK